MAANSALPFICLTDDLDLRSDTWEIRVVEPPLSMDPVRSQRDFKLRPHVHLPEFAESIYIDNTVILRAPPEDLLAQHLSSTDLALPFHSYRETVMDEFLEVARLGLEDSGRVFEQLNHYQVECPDLLLERPFWCGILLRRDSEQVQRAMETWYRHLLRYSRRDQLSVRYALRAAKLSPTALTIDNRDSQIHVLDYDNNRAVGGVRDPLAYLKPPAARMRELELALAKTTEYHLAAHRRMEEAETEVARLREIEIEALELRSKISELNGLLSTQVAEAVRLQELLDIGNQPPKIVAVLKNFVRRRVLKSY